LKNRKNEKEYQEYYQYKKGAYVQNKKLKKSLQPPLSIESTHGKK